MAASYLWHSCPMPSKGCKTPVEDSPCARKSTTGLYLDKACGEKKQFDQTDNSFDGIYLNWRVGVIPAQFLR